MILILIQLFFVAFFINLIYEILHSVLYKTCLEAPLKKYIYLILKGAIFDGIFIVIFYFFVSIVFDGSLQIIAFMVINLAFAFFWEKYSLAKKKWEYSDKMPIILGVGITPFIQLAITGLISVYFISII